jgi:polyhydroxyalkanoate synthesis regulator phasin
MGKILKMFAIKEKKMVEIMHYIKKYANGRLYDTTDKKYITMEEIKNFVRTGVFFKIVLSKTDEDVTDMSIAKIKEEMEVGSEKKKPTVKPKIKPKVKTVRPKIQAKQKPGLHFQDEAEPEPKNIFSQLLLKGGEKFMGYAHEYGDLLYNTMSMAEEELEKRIKELVKVQEIPESEAGDKKKEIASVVKNLRNWLGINVEDRIHDIISTMNLATQSEVEELTQKVNDLNKKLAIVERMEREREDSAEGITDINAD